MCMLVGVYRLQSTLPPKVHAQGVALADYHAKVEKNVGIRAKNHAHLNTHAINMDGVLNFFSSSRQLCSVKIKFQCSSLASCLNRLHKTKIFSSTIIENCLEIPPSYESGSGFYILAINHDLNFHLNLQ